MRTKKYIKSWLKQCQSTKRQLVRGSPNLLCLRISLHLMIPSRGMTFPHVTSLWNALRIENNLASRVLVTRKNYKDFLFLTFFYFTPCFLCCLFLPVSFIEQMVHKEFTYFPWMVQIFKSGLFLFKWCSASASIWRKLFV